MNTIPGLQTTWEQWVSTHSDTLVLDKGGGYRSDSYSRYYTDDRAGILGQEQNDPRLNRKDFVVGVNINGRSKAYPFDELGITPVVNDVVNGVPLLVTFDDSSATGVVFSPMVEGRRLNFRQLQTPEKFLMEDMETRTVWDPLTGRALEGPLAETMLEQMASHYEFWFAWKDSRPETELYQGQGEES